MLLYMFRFLHYIFNWSVYFGILQHPQEQSKAGLWWIQLNEGFGGIEYEYPSRESNNCLNNVQNGDF